MNYMFKRRCNKEFIKRLELDKFKMKITTKSNSATTVTMTTTSSNTPNTNQETNEVMEHTGEGNHRHTPLMQ
jgi:hypothetical protein